MKESYTIIYLQLSVCFFLLLSSCSNNPKDVETFVSNEDTPIEVMQKSELYYTEKGKIKVKIIAEKIERYLNQNPSVYFSGGVLVYFYNDSAVITSTLTAEKATIDDKNQQMTAQINVGLINQEEERLNTEKLIWDEKLDRIFTQEAVSISTKDEVIFGDGFESNLDFSSYKIKNVRGTISVKESKDSVLR